MTIETIAPGTIVLGYAGPQDVNHALAWAAEQAVLEGRTLTLVHAVGQLAGYEFGAMAGAYIAPDDVNQSLLAEGRQLLEEGTAVVRERYPDLSVASAVYQGNASQVLLSHASHAACIVVGSRGRGHLASLLLGSVGVTVAGAATCPVVVVRPHHPGKVRNGVLVGTDCTENTHSTLEYAYREASLRRLPLTVLYSVHGLHLDGDVEVLDDSVTGFDEHRLQLAEAVAGMGEKFPDVRVRTCLGSGSPAKWLAQESGSMDLVVVGHHRTAGFADLVGNGSYAPTVVERAACPVAVVFEAPTA